MNRHDLKAELEKEAHDDPFLNGLVHMLENQGDRLEALNNQLDAEIKICEANGDEENEKIDHLTTECMKVIGLSLETLSATFKRVQELDAERK